MSMKAIRATYKGISFRSRTEARWAVFFDVAGIPWEYEAEGFECDGIHYLPDFLITLNHGRRRVFFEVKGLFASPEDEKKLDVFAREDMPDLFLACGSPQDRLGAQSPQWPQGLIKHAPFWDDPFFFCVCNTCNSIDLQFEGRSDRICCGCKKSDHGDKGCNLGGLRVSDAIARSAAMSFWTPGGGTS